MNHFMDQGSTGFFKGPVQVFGAQIDFIMAFILASLPSLPASTPAMYERDERVPRDEVKIRIANFFGKTVQELFYTPIENYKCSKERKNTDE